MIHIKLDNENRIIWYSIPFEGEILEEGIISANVDPKDIILGQTKLIDNILVKNDTMNPDLQIIFDKVKKQERIDVLKQFLNETDYKVIKCYEASMLDKPLPYDIGLITEERDAWREEIRILEEKLKT